MHILYTIAPYPPPDNIRLTDVREGSLSFSWDSLGPNCDLAIYYVMSDCGGCPDNTSSTTVNCIDLQLSTVTRECTFRIHAELCGSTGNQSSPLTVMLKRINLNVVCYNLKCCRLFIHCCFI